MSAFLIISLVGWLSVVGLALLRSQKYAIFRGITLGLQVLFAATLGSVDFTSGQQTAPDALFAIDGVAGAGTKILEGAAYDPERVAVVVGSALGGQDNLEAEQARMAKRRSLAISPFVIPGLIINQGAGQVAQHLGLHRLPGFHLGRSIDPEQLRVGSREPKDEGLAVDIDPVVAVGDPRLDRDDGRCSAGPHRRERGLEPRVIRHRGEP